MAVCPNCNGRGNIEGPPGVEILRYEKKCPSCHGTGEVSGPWRICDECEGWGTVGEIFSTRCDNCNGRGIVPSRASGESGRRRRGRDIHIHFD